MGQFLYFFPGATTLGKPESVFSDSMQYAINPGEPCASRSIERGPDGNSGVIYTYGIPDDKYCPESQTWLYNPVNKVWVGMWNNNVPHEPDLRRKRMIDGYPFPLQDGGTWTIPRARYACDNSTTGDIERGLALDEKGRIIPGDFLDGQGELNAIAERITSSFLERYEQYGLSSQSILYEEEDPMKILGYNYRVSVPEVVLLKLWNYQSSLAGAILLCLIDYQGWLALQKKTEPDM